MPRLLVVHHTPSPALQEMFEAAVSGARTDEIDDVEVVIRPALTAAAVDVLEADGYLLGTPANIGYMSGALKHFFDGIYYPCLEATRRRPYGLYVHGGMDTTGAVRAVESIAGTGLQWRAVRPPVTVRLLVFFRAVDHLACSANLSALPDERLRGYWRASADRSIRSAIIRLPGRRQAAVSAAGPSCVAVAVHQHSLPLTRPLGLARPLVEIGSSGYSTVARISRDP